MQAYILGLVRKLRARARCRRLLDRVGAGAVPVPIALMRLACETADGTEMDRLIRAALGSSPAGSAAHARLLDLEVLCRSHPEAHAIVRQIDPGHRPRPEAVTEIDYWAAEYDRCVAVSPEASVALYSFGDPRLLQRITGELVDGLVRWAVLGPRARVLDYGCGIGRVTAALAQHVDQVVGVDISAGMLREAGARLLGLSNVQLMSTAAFGERGETDRFDLILAIDVLPYVADPTSLLADLARRLSPGGSLIAMNWSGDRSPADQRAAAEAFARRQGLALVRNGTAEFSLWDGSVFQFKSPSPPS